MIRILSFLGFSLLMAAPASAGDECLGQVASGWVGPMLSGLELNATEKGLELRGYLGDGWVNARVEEAGTETRFNGWIGSQVLSLRIRKTSDVETRLTGWLGGGEPVSLRLKQAKTDEVRLSGYGRGGFVSLSLFRGVDGGIHGMLENLPVNLNFDAKALEAGTLLARGTIGNRGDFAEVSALGCVDARGWSAGATTSEMLALLVLLAR